MEGIIKERVPGLTGFYEVLIEIARCREERRINGNGGHCVVAGEAAVGAVAARRGDACGATATDVDTACRPSTIVHDVKPARHSRTFVCLQILL